MKSKTTSIILILILSCAVLLLLGIMIFLLTGTGRLTDLLPNHTAYSDSFAFDASDVQKIEVDSDYGNVEIRESADDKISVTGDVSDAFKLNAELYGSTLKIKRSHNGPITSFAKTPNVATVISIPNGYESTLHIEADYGDITAQNALRGTLDFSTDIGNITLQTVTGSFSFFSNMGNVEIEKAEILSNSTAKTDMGNVKIAQTNRVNIAASTDLGNCKISGSDSSSPILLKAETDMGNVRIND